eukprot:1691202-Rhodomonas_salina.2
MEVIAAMTQRVRTPFSCYELASRCLILMRTPAILQCTCVHRPVLIGTPLSGYALVMRCPASQSQREDVEQLSLGISLRRSYAMSGTKIGYASRKLPTPSLCDVCGPDIAYLRGIYLRLYSAMSRTEMLFGISLRVHYTMSGTEIGYAASTRSLCEYVATSRSMCGTETGCAFLHPQSMCGTAMSYAASSHSMCGTLIGYATIRRPRSTGGAGSDDGGGRRGRRRPRRGGGGRGGRRGRGEDCGGGHGTGRGRGREGGGGEGGKGGQSRRERGERESACGGVVGEGESKRRQ